MSVKAGCIEAERLRFTTVDRRKTPFTLFVGLSALRKTQVSVDLALPRRSALISRQLPSGVSVDLALPRRSALFGSCDVQRAPFS